MSLSPVGALTIYFDAAIAVDSAARMAKAMTEAKNLEEANERLLELGVKSELDLEREAAARN